MKVTEMIMVLVQQVINKFNMEKKINKTKAVDIIKNMKGRIFTVSFNKKENNELRSINGRYKSQSKLGNISIITSRSKEIKSFDPHNLKRLKANGNDYKIV
jgi:hypothetical protein